MQFRFASIALVASLLSQGVVVANKPSDDTLVRQHLRTISKGSHHNTFGGPVKKTHSTLR